MAPHRAMAAILVAIFALLCSLPSFSNGSSGSKEREVNSPNLHQIAGPVFPAAAKPLSWKELVKNTSRGSVFQMSGKVQPTLMESATATMQKPTRTPTPVRQFLRHVYQEVNDTATAVPVPAYAEPSLTPSTTAKPAISSLASVSPVPTISAYLNAHGSPFASASATPLSTSMPTMSGGITTMTGRPAMSTSIIPTAGAASAIPSLSSVPFSTPKKTASATRTASETSPLSSLTPVPFSSPSNSASLSPGSTWDGSLSPLPTSSILASASGSPSWNLSLSPLVSSTAAPSVTASTSMSPSISSEAILSPAVPIYQILLLPSFESTYTSSLPTDYVSAQAASTPSPSWSPSAYSSMTVRPSASSSSPAKKATRCRCVSEDKHKSPRKTPAPSTTVELSPPAFTAAEITTMSPCESTAMVTAAMTDISNSTPNVTTPLAASVVPTTVVSPSTTPLNSKQTSPTISVPPVMQASLSPFPLGSASPVLRNFSTVKATASPSAITVPSSSQLSAGASVSPQRIATTPSTKSVPSTDSATPTRFSEVDSATVTPAVNTSMVLPLGSIIVGTAEPSPEESMPATSFSVTKTPTFVVVLNTEAPAAGASTPSPTGSFSALGAKSIAATKTPVPMFTIESSSAASPDAIESFIASSPTAFSSLPSSLAVEAPLPPSLELSSPTSMTTSWPEEETMDLSMQPAQTRSASPSTLPTTIMASATPALTSTVETPIFTFGFTLGATSGPDVFTTIIASVEASSSPETTANTSHGETFAVQVRASPSLDFEEAAVSPSLTAVPTSMDILPSSNASPYLSESVSSSADSSPEARQYSGSTALATESASGDLSTSPNAISFPTASVETATGASPGADETSKGEPNLSATAIEIPSDNAYMVASVEPSSALRTPTSTPDTRVSQTEILEENMRASHEATESPEVSSSPEENIPTGVSWSPTKTPRTSPEIKASMEVRLQASPTVLATSMATPLSSTFEATAEEQIATQGPESMTVSPNATPTLSSKASLEPSMISRAAKSPEVTSEARAKAPAETEELTVSVITASPSSGASSASA